MSCRENLKLTRLARGLPQGPGSGKVLSGEEAEQKSWDPLMWLPVEQLAKS